MNYTENYHLPQWNEADRIMRTDFNQMCADIESGFNSHAKTMEDFHQSNDTQNRLTFDRLCRLAYNHLGAVASLETIPRQIGVFCENPNRDTTVSIPGTTWRDGVRYMAMAEKAMDLEAFRNAFTVMSEMQIMQGNLDACVPQVLNFSPTAPGYIDTFYLYFYSTNSHVNIADLCPLRMELKNLDTNQLEWSKTIEYEKTFSGIGVFPVRGVNLPFHGGCRYQLILRPLSAKAAGSVNFQWNHTSTSVRFFDNFPGCIRSCNLQDPEESMGGMVVVHYKQSGPNASVTMRWNGVEMEPAVVRNVSYGSGEIVQEMIYLRRDQLPASNNFSLQFQCGVNSEFWFYDWGAILF